MFNFFEKFGYIVSKTKISDLKGFVEQVDDISLADLAKPILIVGYKEAKKIASEEGKEFDILNKSLDKNLFWTFKKTESKSDFEKDIIKFYSYIINNIIYNINYYYINIYKLKYNKIKKLYNIINSKNKKYIYINNGMIYFLYENKTILGISLKMLKYAGINPNKIINKIKSNTSNIVYDDDFPLAIELKKEIGNKKYTLPFLISKII